MITPVQRIIYSLTAFAICYVLCYAVAEQVNSKMHLSQTWYIWIVFILSQTYLQNRIWSLNKPNKNGVYVFPDENSFKLVKTQIESFQNQIFLNKKILLRIFYLVLIFIGTTTFALIIYTLIKIVIHETTYSTIDSQAKSTNEVSPFIKKEVVDDMSLDEYKKYRPNNYDSPFDSCFRDNNRKGNAILNVTNHTTSDAIIFLYNSNTHKTIRNEYVRLFESISINGIPDGYYYIRVIYGNFWNPNKISPCGSAGFFTIGVNYSQTEEATHLIDNGTKYSNDNYFLKPSKDGNTKTTTIDENVVFGQ